MSSIFQKILGLILAYKYVTLFSVAFLSSLGIPVPAGSSTIASAAFASQGYLNILVVLVVAALGNILGDISMYGLAKKYGKPFFYWIHLRKLIESELFQHAEKVENTYSAPIIILSRFQDQTTTIVNIIAGLGTMKFKRFLLYAVMGDILQVMFYASIGYFFAGDWQALYGAVGVFTWVIALGTLVISIALSGKIARRILK